jgi:hypothetical protein
MIEAVAVGIILLVVAAGMAAGLRAVDPTPSTTAVWITTFLTGVMVHLLCEAAGVNRWYCTHGSACTEHNRA